MTNVPTKFPDSIQVGDEAAGYELPTSRGAAGQAIVGDGTGETSWAPASGAFTMPPNTVQVDPAEPEVPGERYQTIVAAQAYVATQAPGVDNVWGIQVSGVNAEDFTVGAYVYILGEPGTILTGVLKGGVTATFDEYVVTNCRVDDFLIDGAGQLLTFRDCTITGGNSSAAGNLTLTGGQITGGDFSDLALTFVAHSHVNGGIFGEFGAHNHIFRDCTLQDTFPLILGGGDFYNCSCWLQGGNTTFNDGIYRMRAGTYLRLPNPTTFAAGQDLDWHQMVLANVDLTLTGTNQCELGSVTGDNATLTINGAGVTVDTTGCSNLPVTYTAGTWTNDGVLYDNRASGLVSTDTQGAIDELVGLTSETLREYGETLLIVQYATGSTGGEISKNTPSSAYDIWRKFDECYTYCFFDLKVYDGATLEATHRELRFNNTAGVVAWIDANIPRDGSNRFTRAVRMRAYDKVDASIQAPNRIWGENTVYSRLKDPDRQYYSRYYRSAQSTAQWGDASDFLTDLWQAVYGVPHPDAGAMTPGGFNCFWFSGRKENFYRCGYEHTRIELVGDGYGYRSMVTPGGVVTGAQSADWWQYDNTGIVTVCMIRSTGDLWEFAQLGQFPDTKPFTTQAQRFTAGWATAVAFGMTDPSGDRAVLIKPVTIDTFWLPYISPALFRYEYIANYDVQGSNKIRTIPMGGPAYETANVMGVWTIADIADGTFKNRLYGAGEKPGSVRFQVRDLTTGHISPLSNARIRFFGRRRYIQLSALIESAGAR